MPFQGHPDSKRLADFAAGRIDDDTVAIETHLLECASCAEILAHVGSTDELSADLKAALGTEPLDTTSMIGTVIANRYRLVSPIGHGGMGTVWNAEQFEPLEREVAIKLVNEGMDSADGLRRFEAERHVLAQMDHPNIAKVFEAGTFERGRPFFVMELVRGEPITDYCDKRRATPRQRLELFVQVCQAIQHAHQKGVIHRDIKPSNVLVAEYDGQPMPKVIDFGVAKSVQGRRGVPGTVVGGVVGTPEYMSPEQASFDSSDIDTRSDVYALGTLLYELMTGAPPFGRSKPSNRSVDELLRAIREDDPPKPSSRVAAALSDVAINRAMEPASLTRLVRGELDWIIMRAMEKDRARRYATASELAQDVTRYLSGDPILAAPHTTVYRLRKFVRKHRGFVVAASLVTAALVFGFIGTGVGLVRARHAEKEAKEQAAAERRARQAMNTVHADLITNLIDFSTRHQTGSADSLEKALTGRLVEIENWIDQAKIEDPEQLFELQARATEAFRVLGDNAHALQLGEKSYELAEKTFGPNSAHTVGSLFRLSAIHKQLNNQNQAEAFAKRGRDAFARLPMPTTDREIVVQNALMLYLREWVNETALAVVLAERLLQQAIQNGPHEAELNCRSALAWALERNGQFERAIEIQRRVLSEAEKKLTGNELDGFVANAQQLYINIGRYDEALHNSLIRLMGSDNIHSAVFVIAGSHMMKEKLWADAEPLLRKALAMRQKSDPNHWTTFNSMSLVGGCLLGQGKFTEAEPLLLDGYAGMRQRIDKIPEVAKSRPAEAAGRLAELYDKLNRPDEAAKWQQKISMP